MLWMHLCSRAFIAGTNQSIPKVDERLDGAGSISIALKEDYDIRNLNITTSQKYEVQRILHQQMLKTTSNLRAVYRPRLRKIYFYGYPLFYNCIPTSIQDKHFRSSESNDNILGQIFSAEDVSQLANLHGSTHLMSININSKRVKICTPGIVTNQISLRTENTIPNDLLTTNELELFTISHKPAHKSDGFNNLSFMDITSTCDVSFDEKKCSCILCLSRKTAIRSSVSKAKRFIDEAVKSQNNACCLRQQTENAYLINLAHLLFVIVCLRKGL